MIVVQWQGVNVGNAYDLGSSPRSTLISILFCNTYSYAVSKVERTIHPPDQIAHVPSGIKPKAEIEGTP